MERAWRRLTWWDWQLLFCLQPRACPQQRWKRWFSRARSIWEIPARTTSSVTEESMLRQRCRLRFPLCRCICCCRAWTRPYPRSRRQPLHRQLPIRHLSLRQPLVQLRHQASNRSPFASRVNISGHQESPRISSSGAARLRGAAGTDTSSPGRFRVSAFRPGRRSARGLRRRRRIRCRE